jgi:hypothetical protein
MDINQQTHRCRCIAAMTAMIHVTDDVRYRMMHVMSISSDISFMTVTTYRAGDKYDDATMTLR